MGTPSLRKWAHIPRFERSAVPFRAVVHHGNGVNSFFQADLQGGDGLFGVGGKVGARVAW